MKPHLESLEPRLAPVVGAVSSPAIARGSGYDGVVRLEGDNGSNATGSLLFTGLSTRPYTPPVPTLDLFEGVYSAEKLCDVEFNFEYTNRSNGGATPTISNPNWIAAGHNLLPWLYDRKFYYATATPFIRPPATDTDPSVWAPTYESFPFQLLFTDPDV